MTDFSITRFDQIPTLEDENVSPSDLVLGYDSSAPAGQRNRLFRISGLIETHKIDPDAHPGYLTLNEIAPLIEGKENTGAAAAAIAQHNAAPDPHTQYLTSSEVIALYGQPPLRSALPPITRLDGAPLVEGDRWIRTGDFTQFFWSGNRWLSESLQAYSLRLPSLPGGETFTIIPWVNHPIFIQDWAIAYRPLNVQTTTNFFEFSLLPTGGSTSAVASFSTATTDVPTFLSDLSYSSSSNGYGPVEIDRANGSIEGQDGGPLTLDGVTYPKGLGCHAPTEIIYSLNGIYSRFIAFVGVDDFQGAAGSVVFQVWADGTQIYNSGLMLGSSPAKMVNVDIAGCQSLRLVVTDGGDGNAFDHANWADAQLVSGRFGVSATSQGINAYRTANTYQIGVVRNGGAFLEDVNFRILCRESV